MATWQLRQVTAPDGTDLAYRVGGVPGGVPVVLIHGWAQSQRAWIPEVVDDLALDHRVVTVDLRGHGYSADAATGYADGALWAADLEAVLAAEDLHGAALVGWSYGGLVIGDYLRHVGVHRLGGLAFIGAILALGPDRPGGRIGPAMASALPDALSPSPSTATAALANFGAALLGSHTATRSGEARGELGQQLLGTAISTPPHVRLGMFVRKVDHTRTLAEVTLPALVVHGDADPVVDVSVGRHTAEILGVEPDVWAGGQHAPFLEDPTRFCRSLRTLTSRIG